MSGLRGLRVLMTADALGGIWVYGLDLARGLAAEGCSVTLALLGPPPQEAERAAAAAIPGLELVETGLPPDWLAESPDAVRSGGLHLAELARATGADLVHLNNPAYLAGVDFGRPVVAVTHSCLLTWWRAVRGDAPLPEIFAWQAGLVARAYAAADAVLAPSRAIAAATQQAYGFAALPEVVANGRAWPGAAVAAASVPAGPFAFTAGRLWDEGKNVGLLDEVAARTRLPILAAGATAGPGGADVALRRVRALGRLDPAEVSGYLAARPVYAAPALYEPFGLAVLEAAQHGCPLVLSDIPTFRELWQGAAVFAAPRDADAFARALESVAADPARAGALGEAARVRAARFTPGAMAAGTAAAYWRVLGLDAARLAS